jgi:hypothetical protein
MRPGILLALLAACGGAPGTYVHLTVEGGAGVPAGINGLDLSLMLAGRSAQAHFGGAALALPTDLVLDVGKGEGELAISAQATDAGSAVLAEGAVTVEVVREKTVAATLVLNPPAGLLTVDRADYDFGTINQGATAGPRTFVVTSGAELPTGLLSRQISGDAAAFEVSGCEGQPLAPGASCTLQVSYHPAAPGSHQLTIQVSGTPGGSVSVHVTGSAVQPSALVISPSPKDYGPLLDGVTSAQIFTVTNGGTEATGMLTTAVTGSDASQFVKSADGCDGQTLQAGGTCMLTVTFSPSGSTGDRTASLTVGGTPGGTAAAPLHGRALTPASIAFNPPANDFGTVDVGMSVTAVDFTLTNQGGQTSGTLSTALTGDTADFVVDMNACTGQALAYLGTCTVRGHFAPRSYGPKSLTVTLSGTPGGDAVLTWTGTGHDQVTLTVDTPFGGEGVGSVTGPGGIDCPGMCSAILDRQDAAPPMVMLNASPALKSVFGSWSGDCAGSGPTCTLVMDGNKSAIPTFDRQRFTLSVTQSNAGGATGIVTSTTSPAESGELDCGATCSLSRYIDATVTLTASPAPGFYWSGWGGDCTAAGFNPTCAVTMDAGHAVEARFSPANKVFITSGTYNLTTIQGQTGCAGTTGEKMLCGADKLCNDVAHAVPALGSGSAWKAFVSRNGENARDRIPATARGWVRPDGQPFGERLTAILDTAQVLYPLMVDQNGATVGAAEGSWTGTNSNGNYIGAPSGIDRTCQDWETSSGTQAAGGVAGGGSVSWMASLPNGNCAVGARHLLCLQTDYVAVVSPSPPPNPRYMFVSAATFLADAGIAAFDAKCGTEAATHGLPGTYHAFVASSTQSPASRFTARGDAVVRPDGVVVFASDSALLSGSAPLATTNQRADGSYQRGPAAENLSNAVAWVRTGAPAANVSGTDTTTCTNWTIASSDPNGTYGLVSRVEIWMNSATTNCQLYSLPVYCLED